MVAKARKPTHRSSLHSAERYAQDVTAGSVVVGRLVRLAVERHARDLKKPPKGCYFEQAAAERAIRFFGLLRHSKGEWRGQPFELAPWQQFALWVLFGWKRADGARRFRTFYLEVARKNGKSTLLAGIGLYLAFADGEGGAEVYSAATTRQQARIVHSEAQRMVQASPALRGRIGTFKDNLHHEASASKFETLANGDKETLDGFSVHGGLVDELHAHPTRETWDVLETATGARRQPLMVAITTAGFDRQSICWELREWTRKVLEGVVDDETWLGLVFAIDEGDDWRDPAVWPKANPNLGVSCKQDDLARKCKKAQETPAAQNNFRRKHINEWTQQNERWIPVEQWRRCSAAVNLEQLRGRDCFLGMDLSSKIDLTALVALFPPVAASEPWRVLPWFFVPAENIAERERRDRVPYSAWIRDGHCHATDGNVIDYDALAAKIHWLAGQVRIVEIAYDPWNAQHLANQLTNDGFQLIEFRQGFVSYNEPCKELEALVNAVRLAHADHPVLTWCADNVAVDTDAAGNYKPSKAKSTERIDGIVALLMALGRALKRPEQSGPILVYR